jgi:hypothetical protein
MQSGASTASIWGRVLSSVSTSSVFLMVPDRGTSLHYCALAAAAILVFVHLEILHVVVVARAVATGVRRHVPVVSPDLADNVEEGVINVDTGPGGCLDELATETTCKCGALCCGVSICLVVPYEVHARATTDAWRARERTFQEKCGRTFCAHLSLGVQIALVSDNNDGEVVLVLDAQNLLLECDDLLEALARCDAVDEQEAFACSHILLAHGGVLFLASRVEHV